MYYHSSNENCYIKWGVYKTITEDRKTKTLIFFMPNKARTGKKPSQSVPQRKQMQK